MKWDPLGAGIRVLHVDDEPDFAELTAEFLERADDRLTVETAESAGEGLERLSTDEFDCVVSDYEMPGRNGIEFLETIRADDPELPFVLFTGKGSEEVASDAISAGVTEYLQKETGTDQYTVLANRIVNAVEHDRSRRLVEESEQRLREIIDSLPHLLYVVDESGEYRLANEALAEFHGTQVEAIEGVNVTEILDDTEATEFTQNVAEVLDSGVSKRFAEVEISGPDGETHIFEPRLLPSEFSETDETAVLGIAADVTERNARERSLDRTRERIELALEHTNSVVFEIDFDTGEVTRHGTYEELFGQSPDVAPTWQEHCSSVVHPDDRGAFRRFHQELRQGDRQRGDIEYRTDPETGASRWIRAHVHLREESASGRTQALGISRDITEQKHREAELERNERRYQAIFDDPNILVGLLDTDGTVLDINETAMDYVDATVADVTGVPFWKTPWFEHSQAVQEDVKEWIDRAASGEYVEFEADLVRPDGDPYTIEGVFRPVTNDDGEVVSLVISDRDITERKQRERELEQYEAYLEGSNDIITVLDDAGTIQYQSPSVTRILGYEQDELVGTNGFSLIHPDDRDELFETFRDLISSPTETVTAEARFRAADGEWRWLEVRGTDYLDHPMINGVVTNNRDITDRKRRENRLEALNHTARKLIAADTREEVAERGVEAATEILSLDANAVHLYDEDRDGLVAVAQSDTSHRIIGDAPVFERDDSIAWRVYDDGEPLAVDDVHADPDVYNPDSPVRSELILPIGDDGILIAGSLTPAAFDSEDLVLGEILARTIATALEQVTRTEQLRSRERELMRQNGRLEEFASVVSHDLQNPLQVAEGRLELLKEECESEQLDAIERALGRMNTLIEDLLTLAREGDRVQDQEPVDLAELTRNCWRNVETPAATLNVETAATIRADRSRLQQLLENLVRNAVDHGCDDVTVTVGDLDTGFYVADDGPGISPDERESIFEAGYSTSRDGTGFGLSIVQEISSAHGWDVTVTDSTDAGARFEITECEIV